MRPPIVSKDQISALLNRFKVMTTAQLTERFSCSSKTIFRKLQLMEYISSYNENKTGITLSNIPEFDEHGLWKYRHFGFSRWKTLNETIQNMVDNSYAGMSAKELSVLLQINIYHHLTACVQKKRIYREPQVHRPIYYHMDMDMRQRQMAERLKIIENRIPRPPPLSNENVIDILLVIIEHHVTAVDKLMPVLDAEGVHFSRQSIDWLFKKYDIEKKGSPSS